MFDRKEADLLIEQNFETKSIDLPENRKFQKVEVI